MSNSKGKQPKLSAFFVKKDPSTSGTGVVQGDHAGEPSAVHCKEQDDKLKIHYPDIGLLQKTSAQPISPDIICDLLKMAEHVGSHAYVPRQAMRQRNRNNVPAETPRQYWKRALFYPLLDHVCLQSAPRYSAQFLLVSSELQDMPANMATMLLENFDLPAESQESLQVELDRWVVVWSRAVGEKLTVILDTLDNTVEILYPNIYRALAILLTMPVSTATAERSFSAMRRLETYLRNTMLANRLIGLTLMNVYRNAYLNKAIDMFARKEPRAWDLMLDWTRSPWAKVD